MDIYYRRRHTHTHTAAGERHISAFKFTASCRKWSAGADMMNFRECRSRCQLLFLFTLYRPNASSVDHGAALPILVTMNQTEGHTRRRSLYLFLLSRSRDSQMIAHHRTTNRTPLCKTNPPKRERRRCDLIGFSSY